MSLTGSRFASGHQGPSIMGSEDEVKRSLVDFAVRQTVGRSKHANSSHPSSRGTSMPPSMKEAIEQFRTQLGAAIDSIEFVKKVLDRQILETGPGKGLCLMFVALHEFGYGTTAKCLNVAFAPLLR